MRPSHEIFRRPFPVTPTMAKIDTPEHYRKYFGGEDLPAQLDAWRVQRELKARNYGLVSDGYGFEDSPDCEYISGGKNSKGPLSLALGRQGNWFFWGFCASPDEMTEEARKVFLNTVVYMRRFDGKPPLGTRSYRAREWALMYATYLGREQLQDYGRRMLDPALLQAAGEDAVKVEERLRADLEYVLYENAKYRVDEDAKALGIGNRDPAILDRCVELLAAGGDEAARARRLLERYTGIEHTSVDAWRAWVQENRGRLYFTDTGGYRWKVAPLR